MTKTARITGIVLAVAMLMGLGTVGSALAQDESPTPEGATDEKITFTWGDTSEPSSMNPMSGYLATDFYFWNWAYHLPLSWALDDMSAVNDLVTNVETSEDATHFTYTIKDGIKWSDGEPLTAEDVAFSWNLYKNNHAYLPQGYVNAFDGDAVATSDTVVEFDTKEPSSLYGGDVAYLYTYIIPEHIFSKFEKPKQYDGVPSVSSGPWFIAEYKTGEFVRMERNPYWSGPEPVIDEIIYRIYKSEDAEAEALKAGELDFAYFDSPNIFESLQNQPDIETLEGSIPSFDEIAMNNGSSFQEAGDGFTPHGDGHPALQDVTVRRAIRMAINSQEIVDKVLLGHGVPGDTIVPPVTIAGARWEPSGEDLIPWDIEGANQLLEDAGYVDSDGDGVREMPADSSDPGRPLEFRYYVQTNDQNTVKTAPFVRSWLKQIGIEAKVTAMSSLRLGDELNAGTYDLFHWGWIPDPDPNSVLSYFTCAERPPDGKAYGNNDAYYCNPDYDQMYEQQRSTLDLQERLNIIHEMQKLYYEESPYAVIYYLPIFNAWRTDTFTGYVSQPSPNGDALTGWSTATASEPNVLMTLHPVSAGSTAKETKGIPAGVWIAIAVGAVVVVGGAILLARRRGSDEDRA